MVKLNKIYTRTGDDGTTGLVRGPRRLKYDLRVNCFGTVDEANSAIGMARLSTVSMPKVDNMLGRIQNDLFDLGSDLATPGVDPDGTTQSLRITADQAAWLEQMIDLYNEGLAPLGSFVLPGGSPLSAALHVARTVVRRAERLTVELVLTEPGTNPETIVYLNRLSDLLFVLSRVANGNGKNDVLWAPGRFGHDQ
jgi:cob(I)alamin adenosyltransferase